MFGFGTWLSVAGHGPMAYGNLATSRSGIHFSMV